MADDLQSAALSFFSQPSQTAPAWTPPTGTATITPPPVVSAATPAWTPANPQEEQFARDAENFFQTPNIQPDNTTWYSRLGTTIRDSLSPLIGPSESQKLREGAPTYNADGNIVGSSYKPAGSQIERSGLSAAINAPVRQIAPQIRATVADIGAAAGGDTSAPNLTALSHENPQDADYGKPGSTPYDVAQSKEKGWLGYLDRAATQMLPDLAVKYVLSRAVAGSSLNAGEVEMTGDEMQAAKAAGTLAPEAIEGFMSGAEPGKIAHGMASAVAFGQNPDGSIDPGNAAVMGILPTVGDLGAKAVSSVINSPVTGNVVIGYNLAKDPTALTVLKGFMGSPKVNSELAAKALEEFVGRGGAQTAFLTASQLPQISKLPQDQQGQAIGETVGYGLAFSLLSIPGVIDPSVPSGARQQIIGRVMGDIAKQFEAVPKIGPDQSTQGNPNATDTEQQPGGVQSQPPGIKQIGQAQPPAESSDSLPGPAGQPAPPEGQTPPVGPTEEPLTQENQNGTHIGTAEANQPPTPPAVSRGNLARPNTTQPPPSENENDEGQNVDNNASAQAIQLGQLLPGNDKVSKDTEAARQAARQETDTNPSDAQKEAENYAKGKFSWNGLKIAIENPRGSTRSGVDAGGNPWSVKMPDDYGHILGARGADGDLVDVHVGPNLASDKVFVVDQHHLTEAGQERPAGFDETKSFIGYNSAAEVIKSYNAGFSDNTAAARLGALSEMTVGEYKEWLKNADHSKPASDYVEDKLRNQSRAEARGLRNGKINKESNESKKSIQAAGQPGISGGQRSPQTQDVEPAGATPGAARPRAGGQLGGEQPQADQTVGGERSTVAESLGGSPEGGVSGADRSGVGVRTPEPERAVGDVWGAVAQTPEQQPRPLGSNYVITAVDQIGKGGLQQKYADNVSAIKLLRVIEAEKRPATPGEQAVLARYVGWGGLKSAFSGGSQAFAAKVQELKALLTSEEYEAARRSTLDAHYTSPVVIGAIYDAMKQFGFTGGKMIEGGVGVGHFIGLIPASMRERTSYLGVEQDPITARICSLLYPQADIRNKGFQDVNLTRDDFDGSVGNPPFGQTKLYDKNFKEESNNNIHTYFIAKTLASLRPGGVMGFVVSHFFLDTVDPTGREFVGKNAQFIGAIRLPNTAFKENANTEVTTDIVFFQRVPDGIHPDDDWTKTVKIADPKTKEPITVNKWLVDHPDMMLGKMTLAGKMYAGGNQATLEAAPGADLKTDLAAAVAKLPANIYTPVERRTAARLTTPDQIFRDDVPATVKIGGFFLADGKVYRRDTDVNDSAVATRATFGIAEDRVKGMVKIRDAFTGLVREELTTGDEATMGKMRAKLNKLYDDFVDKYGLLNSATNRRAFYDDPESSKLLGLEKNYDAGVSGAVAKKGGGEVRAPKAKKADIFTKRANSPYQEVTKVSTAKEALTVSMNQRGGLDLDYMSKLSGIPVAKIEEDLHGLMFKNPEGGYEEKTLYLSGNVRNKLKASEAAAAKDPAYRPNVDALKAVIPKDIAPTDIGVPLGAPWIPPGVLSDFAKALTGAEPRAISYLPSNGGWLFKHSDNSLASTRDFGTSRMSFGDIMAAGLNGKSVVVMDSGGRDEKPVVNQQETALANAKLEDIKRRWQDWLWEDANRRTALARIYNDTFNSYVDSKYDGSHLSLPGKNPAVELRQHQKNVAWRIITDPKVLMDHVVGSGKTYSSIAGFMELRRTGRVKKPLFVVPNHLITQWRDSFVHLYPNANILAAAPADFKKDKREKFFGKTMSGEYDAIIVGHSSFKKLGVTPETESGLLHEMIQEIVSTLSDVKKAEGKGSGKSGATRLQSQLEAAKERIEARLAKLADIGNRDRGTTFEETGIDGLMVDESHEFKNLFYTTQMQNIAGLGTAAGSQRAFDLLLKTRYMRQRFGGKAPMVFATGTPISNSLVEMYTLQRYLQPEKLEEMNLKSLDAWSRVFGQITSDVEVSPSGTGYKMSTRFRRFANVGDLASIYRTTADVITMADLQEQAKAEGKVFPLPKVKGGKPTVKVVERTDAQAKYFGVPDENGIYPDGTILHRIANIPKDKSIDNMLAITSDARLCGLDARLTTPGAPDDPGSKVNECVREVLRIHKAWEADKGAQLIFCDLSTPKSARGKATAEAKAKNETDIEDEPESEDPNDDSESATVERGPTADDLLADRSEFSVYDDVKKKLVAAGVKPSEFAFIHDYNTPLQKAKLYDQVNRGDVRVLMGSTTKMGAGMNAQKKLVALHHLDAPWRPSDLIQREGRILRQGNEFYERDPNGFEVEIPRYASRMTYDTRMWQLIEQKATAIEGFRLADRSMRTMEDVQGQAASAAEMKAAASGNPLILRDLETKTALDRLTNIYRAWQNQRHQTETAVGYYRGAQARFEDRKKSFEAAIKTRDDNTPPEGQFQFTPTAGKPISGERKEAKEAAYQNFLETAKKLEISAHPWGKYRGFNFVLKAGSVTETYVEGGEMKNRKGKTIEVYASMPGDLNPTEITDFGPGTKITQDGLFARLDNWLTGFDAKLNAAEITRNQEVAKLSEYEAELKKPFGDQAALEKARQEYDGVQAELRMSAAKKNLVTTPPAELGSIAPSLDEAREITDKMLANFPNAPEVKFVIEPGWRSNGNPIAGWTSGNQVTINLANIPTPEYLQTTLAEEIVGHYGIETALGDKEFQRAVDQLGDGVSDETLAPIAKTYGLNLRDAEDRRNAVIEYLAKQANFNSDDRGFWGKLWDAIKAALRRLFGWKTPSDEQVGSILGRADAFLRGKTEAAGPGPEGRAAVGGVQHQVMGKQTTVGSRETSNAGNIQEQVDLTGKLLARAAVPATLVNEPDPRRPGHTSQVWQFVNDGTDMSAAGAKLLASVKWEISDLKQAGKHGGRLGNLIDSISMNFRRGYMEHFPQAIREQLYGVVRDEASFHAMALGALAHHSVDIQEIGHNPDLALIRIYHDAFGGDQIKDLVSRIMTNYGSLFTPTEAKAALAGVPGAEDMVAKLEAAWNHDSSGRIYTAVHRFFKPKVDATLKQMQSGARIREAINHVIANAKSLGVVEPAPTKRALTPEERLALMTKPETAGRIQRSIEKSVGEAEVNAGNTAWRKSVANNAAALADVNERIAAGEEPPANMVEDGLDLPEYAHWRVIRDGLLNYSPTTVKLARSVLQGRIKGMNFRAPNVAQPDTRVDLAALAKSPDAEVARVTAAQLHAIEGIMAPDASDATKQVILEAMRKDIVEQIERIRGKIRDAVLKAPQQGPPIPAGMKAEQRINELLNAKLFSDPQLDLEDMVARVAAKGPVKALLPKMADLLKAVVETPYYRQPDFEAGLVTAVENKFGVMPSEAKGFASVFRKAVGTKMEAARATAAKQAMEALTPKERTVLKKKSIRELILRNANAGNFDSGDILRQIAAKNGYRPPSDEQVARLKALAGRGQELGELTHSQIDSIRNDPTLSSSQQETKIDVETRRKKATLQDESNKVNREMASTWTAMAKPIGLRGFLGFGKSGKPSPAQNLASSIVSLATVNELLKPSYVAVKLPIHLAAQGLMQSWTQTIERPWTLYANDRQAGRPTNLLADVVDSIQDQISSTMAALRPAGRAAAREFIGQGSGRDVARMMSGSQGLERLASNSKQLWLSAKDKAAAGNLVGAGVDRAKAVVAWVFSAPRWISHYIATVDAVQGTILERQELLNQVEIAMRESSASRGEISAVKEEIAQTFRDGLLAAKGQAAVFFASVGITPSKAQLNVAADRCALANAYAKVKLRGLPADDFKSRTEALRQINAWQNEVVHGLGGVAVKSLRAITGTAQHHGLPPSPFILANAAGQGLNYMLLALPGRLNHLGTFETPWSEGPSPYRMDARAERQRSIFWMSVAAVAAPIIGLMMAGMARVQMGGPRKKDERDAWTEEGHRPYTVEIDVPGGGFVAVSLTVGGPLLRAYLPSAQAALDVFEKHEAAQKKENEEAAKRGLRPVTLAKPGVAEIAGAIGKAEIAALFSSSTLTGAMGSVTDGTGSFVKPKAVASLISKVIPGLPAFQDIQAIRGVALDPRQASVWNYLLPLDSSGARETNIFGDPVKTPSDIQRVVQSMTGGTYLGNIDPTADPDARAYENMIASGFTPPEINPNKGYAIDGEYRPLTSQELQEYTEARGVALKAAVSNLATGATETQVKEAFNEANTSALASVGAQSTPAMAEHTASVNRGVRADANATQGAANRTIAGHGATVGGHTGRLRSAFGASRLGGHRVSGAHFKTGGLRSIGSHHAVGGLRSGFRNARLRR